MGTVIRKADAPKSVYVKTDYDQILRRNTHQLSKTKASFQPKRKSFLPDTPAFNKNQIIGTEQTQHAPDSSTQPIINNDNVIRTSIFGRPIKPIQKLDL